MASASLVPVAREGFNLFDPISYSLRKNVNLLQKRFLNQPPNIIWHTNAEKFRYDDYLAISVNHLLSYVIGFDAYLGVHYDSFWLRWAILERSAATICSF